MWPEWTLLSLAHPTRFERVTFAFGGQRSGTSTGFRPERSDDLRHFIALPGRGGPRRLSSIFGRLGKWFRSVRAPLPASRCARRAAARLPQPVHAPRRGLCFAWYLASRRRDLTQPTQARYHEPRADRRLASSALGSCRHCRADLPHCLHREPEPPTRRLRGFRDVADYFSNPRQLTAYWDIAVLAQPSWGKVGLPSELRPISRRASKSPNSSARPVLFQERRNEIATNWVKRA